MIRAADEYEEHLRQLARLFEVLKEIGLTMRLLKCKFIMKEVEFLGFMVSEQGVRHGKSKLKAVEDYPRPESCQDIGKFLDLAGFFRRFFWGFAALANLLTVQLKKDAVFERTPDCEAAFKQLEVELASEPILAKFTWGDPIQLHCEASGVGLGAVLMQKIDGYQRPISIR